MRTRKLIGQLHLWLGLATGLVVFIVSLTGCLYVFIDEIKPVVYRGHWYVTVPEGSSYRPLDELRTIAQAALGAAYPIQSAELPRATNRSISFRARQFTPNAFGYNRYMVYAYRVYVNPYTGAVLKVENSKWEFFNVMVNLHIHLLLGHRVGGPVIAWSVAAFVVLLLTGLVLWWPRNRKAAKPRLWFRWRKRPGAKRINYDLHNILGFYAFGILLIIAFTGLVWAFQTVDDGMQWLANGGRASTASPPLAIVDTTQQQQVAVLDRVAQHTIGQYPDADMIYLSFPRVHGHPLSVSLYSAKTYSIAEARYDPFTGDPLYTRSFDERDPGARLRALNYPIHTGSIAGLPGKILAFLASLIAASLPVTGVLVWLGKKKK